MLNLRCSIDPGVARISAGSFCTTFDTATLYNINSDTLKWLIGIPLADFRARHPPVIRPDRASVTPEAAAVHGTCQRL